MWSPLNFSLQLDSHILTGKHPDHVVGLVERVLLCFILIISVHKPVSQYSTSRYEPDPKAGNPKAGNMEARYLS